MRILHCCLANYYIDNYGYQENILPIYHYKLGNEVAIIASTETYIDNIKLGYVKPSRYYTKEGIPIIRLGYKRILPRFIMRKLRLYKGLKNVLYSFKPDIIFLHNIQFCDIGLVRKYVIKNPEVKIFADSHADFVNSARGWVSRKILHGIIYKHCAKVIEPLTTKFYGTLPIRNSFLINVYNISEDKIDLLPLGLDDEKIDFSNRDTIRGTIRLELDIDTDDFVVISGGKLNKQKNIHLLIKAIIEIQNCKIKLILFGSLNEDLEKEIDRYKKSEQIKYIGWINADEVYKYFFASDLAVFPGTHSVLWEQAVGLGLPCVFKKWKEIDHIDLNGNCLFLENDSAEEIKQKILQLYDDRILFNKLKLVAEEKGVSYFSYKRIAQKTISDFLSSMNI